MGNMLISPFLVTFIIIEQSVSDTAIEQSVSDTAAILHSTILPFIDAVAVL